MHIVRKFWGTNRRQTTVSIADAIEASISDAESSGTVECLSERCDKQAKIIGVLVQALYNKNLLSNDDVASMLSFRHHVVDKD